MKMSKTCKLVVEGGMHITGVKIGEMFFPFEDINEAHQLMLNTLNSHNSYWAIKNEANKLMQEQKSKHDTAINEIIDILAKNELLPVAVG